MAQRQLILGAVAALTLLVGSLAAKADNDTLRFRLGEDPESLYNVETISLTADQVTNGFILERLVYFDADGNPQPWLSESWQVSDDQKEIVFKLRKGIKFHDGTDFNAAAVKAQYDAIFDPANASPQKPVNGPLELVEAIDDNTVRFKFTEPFAPFFVAIANAGGGINSPTAVAKHGKNYGRHPVGTGPYMFESWIPGTELTFIRNPNYHAQFRTDVANKGAPKAEKIILTVIAEEGVALAALETGELTAAVLQADTIEQFVGNDDFKTVIDETSPNLVFLEFNHMRPPFDDPMVRTAIGHAIDRKAAVAAAWSGFASSAFSPLSLGIPGHDKEIGEKYGTPYNPAKAKEILATAGWVDSDNDGLLDKDGRKAEFLIKSYAGFTHIERTLQVIQSNLADLGVTAKLETADWGAFYPSLLDDDWDMDLMRWTYSDGGVLNDLFLSPGHRKKLAANSSIDDTLVRCNTTMDPGLRRDCLSQAQQALLEDMTIVPILTNWVVTATQKNVNDYTIDYLGYLIPGDIWLSN